MDDRLAFMYATMQEGRRYVEKEDEGRLYTFSPYLVCLRVDKWVWVIPMMDESHCANESDVCNPLVCDLP